MGIGGGEGRGEGGGGREVRGILTEVSWFINNFDT